MMIPVPIAETVKIKRMTEFAAEVLASPTSDSTSTFACWSTTCTETSTTSRRSDDRRPEL